MSAQAALWADVYLVALKPTVGFLEKVWLVLFRPSAFATRIDLRDRSSFIRQARFFVEAVVFTILLSSLSASVGELWLVRSEARYWAFTGFIAVIFVIAVYLHTLFIVRPRVSFRDVLHLFFPIAAGVMVLSVTLRMLYRGGTALIDMSVGTSLSAFVPPEPFNNELWTCLTESSRMMRIAFGSGETMGSGKPFLVSFLEAGGGAYIIAITSTAVIAAQTFFISKRRATVLAASSIILGLATIWAIMIGAVVTVALQTDCANMAYLRMGRKDPELLLSYLARTQQMLLPDEVMSGVLKVTVGYDKQGLIYEYRDSNAHAGKSLAEVEADVQAVGRNVFCDLSMDREHYFWVLRDLGLGVTGRYKLTRRNAEVIASVRPANCRMNFAYGPVRYLARTMRADQAPKLTGSIGR